MERVPIKFSGVYVRVNNLIDGDIQLFTIPLNGCIYQWWKGADGAHKNILLCEKGSRTTKLKDQYLLVPMSILYDWKA
jgi:hypothetical protein